MTRSTGKVFNHSKHVYEDGTLAKCPRCHGFGARLGDDGACSLCRGDQVMYVTLSGWVRRKRARAVDSELY